MPHGLDKLSSPSSFSEAFGHIHHLLYLSWVFRLWDVGLPLAVGLEEMILERFRSRVVATHSVHATAGRR